MKCQICEGELHFRWTDSHGVGACTRCGAPYRLYHYANSGERLDKEPELMILPDYIALAKEYWEKHHRNVAPGAFNMPGSSYEVATGEDFETFAAWIEKIDLPTNEEKKHED